MYGNCIAEADLKYPGSINLVSKQYVPGINLKSGLTGLNAQKDLIFCIIFS